MSDAGKKTDAAPAQTVEQRARQLLDKLWADKDLGPKVRAHAKEMFSDISLPEDDPSVAAIKAELEDTKSRQKELLDKLSARDKADEDARSEAAMQRALNAARTKYSLSDEGFQKMLDRMKDTKNYTDPEAAAAWVVSQLPKPEPASGPSWLPKSANLFGSQEHAEEWEALHKNPQKYMDDQLKEFVRDPEKFTRETLGLAA